ncbi:MAG: GNAT family N-acetyltransferase [Chloroflexi bacterium]|nr:GNAT family N-acetyltransferase [Chloroflexota bacterium]
MATERPFASSHIYRLSAYPKEVTLRDGARVVLKPMSPQDGEALQRFFLRIPADERYYMKDDVASPQVIQRWARELDYDRALPILAWVDDTVVADGTLHRTRAGARRHVGELRILVAPEYRSLGLGSTMIQELANIANENGLERLTLQAIADKEIAAIKAAEAIGFGQVAVLTGHGKDLDGHPRDIIILEMPLGEWFNWWVF